MAARAARAPLSEPAFSRHASRRAAVFIACADRFRNNRPPLREDSASFGDAVHMADSDTILETRSLVKEFKGFVAVNDVSLRVKRGQIHALIGPNGAGKTTFFNLLTKFLIPTRGTILFNGHDITFETPVKVARRGIVRSFQISATFPHLTVLENVRIALQRGLGTSFHFWRPERSLDALNGRALELLATVGLQDLAGYVTVELPYGRKRALEIATTLAMDPELMLLDEPTQGMGHEDVERVTQLIKKVAANRTVLMVEHNMNVVATIADTITVLQRGQIIAEGPYSAVSTNPQVLEAYMGSAEAELQGAHG
jgi:branched-chain amino acid transport system ATP-binding protein